MIGIRQDLVRARSRRDGREDGFSLIETIVAISIFAVFSGLVMSAIIAMLNSTAKTQSVDDGAAATENLFQSLDHEVRYADEISPNPGVVGGNWWVEWHNPSTPSTVAKCTQLEYVVASGILQERTWTPPAVVGGAPVNLTGWKLLASNLVNNYNASASPPIVPFAYVGTSSYGTGANKVVLNAHQQLALYFSVRPGGSTTKKTALTQTKESFTALNSTPTTGILCTEVPRS